MRDMKFNIMSRENARLYSTFKDIDKTIIISITDKIWFDNVFCPNENILDILYLKFDDVEEGEKGCMTSSQAQEIIDFVNKYIDKVEMILVHCGAGISRSAGVCAALMKILIGDDSFVFENPRYCPNMLCYRLVLEAYFGSYDEEEANKKLAVNIDKWKEANEIA